MVKRTQRIGAAALAALALSVTACSSGDSSGSASGTAEGSGDCPGLADAEAYLAEAIKNPAGVGYDAPVTKPIPPGQQIVALETPVPVADATNDIRGEALQLLGWEQSRIIVEGTPEGPAAAMSTALDRNPDLVFYSGYDPATIEAPLARAGEAQIPVIAESVPDNTDPAIVGIVRDEVSNDQIGKMSAAHLVVDTNCAANVEAWSVPSQPIITTYQASLEKWLGEWCPDCEVNVNDYEFSDIGTNVPGMVVSALQQNPDANYVVFGYGESILGLEPALAAAGLTEQVQIGGAIPGPDQYEGLRDGTHAFWAADSGPATTAWRSADMMVRALSGEDLSVVQDAPVVAQLLTPDNIGEAPFEDGYWIGYDDFAADYSAMWGLS